ncbi:hypothetical protein [Micromonospora cremea]|uniref:hypothetical protein n=1 Tax=Micromonospora cremea TaxID=709881 RepID=UPI00117FD45B
MFVSRDGSPLRGDSLYQAFVRARKKVDMDDLTFHDLRHTGQTLAAQTGATKALRHNARNHRRPLPLLGIT